MAVEIFSSGTLVSSGMIIENATIASGGNNSMYISSGGVANSTTVNSRGVMAISSGGVANSTTVNSDGSMFISSGGVANSTTVNSSGFMYIASGGTALNVTWTPCVGYVAAQYGAYVTYTSKYSGVYFGSNLNLLSHTQIMDNKIVSSGSMYVMSGGVANSTTVNYGEMNISSGGIANDTTVNSYGYMYICSGGVANRTTVNSYGFMFIFSGGVANDTTVNSSLYVFISSGGVANRTTVNRYGSMHIHSGAKHKGTLQMANGAYVSAFEGSIIDFTVADRTASDGYLINNLSLIKGTPTYTITVSAEQADGTYKLAQGAIPFTGSITIGDGTTSYGSISVYGEDFVYNGTTYSLDKVNGNLTLTVRGKEKAPAVFIYRLGSLVSSGAIIENATIAGGGNNIMYVSSGGTANSTTVNSSGEMYISSGGVANSTTVNYDGRMDISSGGVANSTTVNSRSVMDIWSGGTANSTTVNYGCNMFIFSGGTALSIKENGGYVEVRDGANVTFVSNTINGITITDRMTVHKNTIANSTTVNGGGYMYISSGGVANNTTLSRGAMYISSVGVANSTTVNFWGDMYISSGGTANSTTVNSGGYMFVSSGGTALNITWTPCVGQVDVADGAYVTYTSKYSGVYLGSNNNSSSHTQTMDNKIVSGSMYVMSGGVANSTTVTGRMYISSGGVANRTTVSGDNAYMRISSDGVANSTTVNYGGRMDIYSGGVANSTTVNYDGSMYISSGGVANSTTVNEDCYMYISSGGTANSTTVNSSGRMEISSGGVVNSTTVNSRGYMRISSGGVANSTTVNLGGSMYIFSGGTALSIKENGGYVSVDNGANVTFVSNTINGITITDKMTVHKNTIANSTTVNSSGRMYISSGGVANSTRVNSSGLMRIYSGGVANSTTVNDGDMWVSSGGVANNTTMYGSMSINSGGKHTGTLQMANGAVVSAYQGSIIDFTVVDRTASDGYLINNLSLIKGTPTYTITVSAEQSDGTYKLAQGAEAFTGTISIGDGTTSYGSITVNGEDFVYNGTTYSLDQVNGNLTLSIEKEKAPAVFIYSSGTLTSSGAVIDNATLANGGNNSMHIFSGGVANSTTVNSDGYMFITSGGVANSTTVNSCGEMRIPSGGVANSTTVNSSGYMDILGVANSTTVNSWGYMDILGVANSTTVNSCGEMRILSGGVANSTTVNSSGYMRISSGGKHTGSLQIANGADVSAYKGSIIDFTVADRTASDGYLINNLSLIKDTPTYTITVSAEQSDGTYKLAQGAGSFTGSITIGDGTTSYGSITVNGEDFIYNDTTYSLDQVNGNLTLSIEKEKAPAVFIYRSGSLVSWGAIIENATIRGLGGNNSMYISSGGTANSTTVNYLGWMYIISGGTANSTTVNSSGFMRISSGGIANDTTVNDGGDMYISSGGVANSTTVNDGGYMIISYDGVANSTTVNSGGYMYIASGGTATDITALDGARLYITVASNTYIQGIYNGSAFEMKDAYISGYTVNSYGYMYICSGGTANRTTVNSGGSMYISSGGVANSTTVNSYGFMFISSGGTANDFTLKVGGQLGGFSFNEEKYWSSYVGGVTEISNNVMIVASRMLITSGGTANNTTVNNWGSMYISSGGVANSTTVNSCGEMRILSGGVANSTTVNNGSMYIYSGGVANNTTVNSGGGMSISSGGVANDTTVNSGGRMYISSGGKHTGSLQIANGARVSAYEGSIIDFTVVDRTASDDYLINDLSLISGTPTYTITVSAEQADGTYKLAQGAESFTGSITIGDGTINYGSITVNGDVFKYNGVDYQLTQQNGNLHLSIGDFTPPAAPTYTVSNTALTNQNVTVSAVFSNDSVVKQYSLNGNDWQTYTDGIVFTENGTVSFRGQDAAGNYSEVTSYEVTNIDKVAPTLDITADKTTLTNQNVILTATVSDGTVEYYDGKNWVAGSTFEVTANGTYQFRVTDAAGNTVTDSIIVSNIDKVAPTLDITADKTAPTNQNVVLTATVSDGTVEYFDGKNWVSGSTFEVSANGTYQFRVTDAAGNSVTDSIIVSNIDKVAPTLDISADKTAPTNQNVVLTATVSDGTVEYFANGKWNVGTSLTVTENGTYQFRVTDAVGNSVTDSIVVNNIDKVAPTLDITADKTTLTNQNVILTATVSDGTVEYFDGKNWVAGSTFEVSANGTYQFRVTDAAGNSVTDSIVVNNIDKVAPTLDISADKTTPTNQNVVLTATVSDGTVEYFANGKWNTGNSLTVTENGTYQFRVTDAAGNSVTDSIVVNNIDKVAPTLDITADKTAPTNQNVVLTATVSDGTVEYFANGKWNAGNSLTVTENGTYQFRVTDAAGNSVTDSIVVNNIDKVAPTLDISADKTAPTNQNVVLTATVSDGTVEYFDGKNWVSGSTFEVSANGTYQFRVTDAVGNTVTDSIIVSNIDKVAPTLDITADKTAPTNQNVVLTATVSDGTVEYYDGKNWVSGSTFEVSANGTYQFRVTDEAGNSVTDSIVVNNIDKVAPTLDITADKTVPTNQNVVLTATVSDGTVEYFADGKWNVGTSLTVTENGTYQFRVTDAAGNSVTDSIVVNNIDKVAPTLEVSGNVTEWTNNDVVLSATASDGTIEYFDGENWVAGSTLTVTQNGTYQFRVTDLAGNITETSVVVDKIDKTAPDNPVASADIIAQTRENVTVTATFAEDSVKNEYSLDGKIWNVYTEGIVFDVNGTVYFRSTDHVGNISETVFEVTNIDKVAPTLDITADKTAPTNQNVVLTATVSDGTVEYYDGKNWVAGSTFEVSANGTYQFRVTDAVGNTVTDSIIVNNIDKVAPTLDISADKTAPTNQNVVLTATVSDGTVEYFDGKNWVSGSTFEVSVNGTYQFRVTDAAGNSVTDSIVVNNIDKVAPTLDITADKTAPTNQDVVLTATVSDGTVEYFANGKWNAGNSLTVTENGTYQFRVTDEAGNSVTDSIVVNNIDKVVPTLEVSADKTAPTNQNVVLTATVSDGTVEYYDGKNWVAGSTFEVSANGTYQFRVTDAAGNSVTDSIVVNNIDKVVPTLDISADKTAPTNQNVILTATVSDGTVEYYDGKNWVAGSTFEVSANGTYQFRVTDAAGNSVTDSIVVNNIDKVAPTLDITADKTTPTNQNVVLTATVSDGVVEYFANGKWNSGNSLTVTENGTYQFRVTDTAGNSVTDSIVVNNIDKVAPTLEISGNATDWTNKNVILKAIVSDGRVEHFDGEFWVSGSTFEVSANGTYQFRVTDAAGNVTQKSVTVNKIDKIAPDKPVAKADITSVTTGNVTVSATFAEDSVRNEYSFNVRTWLTYSREIVFDENGTVYFRSTDAAGNVSAITKYAVTNIDRVGPDKPVASADILELTNQNVTVSAVFSNDSAIKQYSFDGQNWQTYTQGVVFEQNGTIYFRSYDASGNVSPTASYEVANIDKVAPTLEINGNATKWTNEDVVLTAAVSDGTVEYFANGKWNAGTVFTAVENGTYQFRVTDEAGNVTQKSVVVDKIDKTAPVIDNVAADITEITHFDVKVTADFSDNNGFTAQYKINDGEWIDYLDGVIMSENGTVYFKAADEAGNETYAEYTVSNIDKLAPDMPIVTFWERGYISNDPIIVSAVFAENSALKQYSFNGVDWFDYTDALYVRTSGEVFFRSCDIAGNYSPVATAVVKEIDDTADSLLTEYIFVNAKYSEKNTSNKEQNGIPLVYGENAFNTLYDFKHSADEKIVMLDAAVNIFNNTDLTDIGTMTANVSLPKKKMTVNNYSYSAKSSVRGKLNINGKDTGDVVFENFATVNLSNSANVNSIEGGKASSTYTVKTSYKQGVKNETVTNKITKSASGKAVLNNASANEISDYSSVTLDGSSVGKIENNAYKLTETVKTVGSTVVNSKRTEQFSAGGTVVLKNNSVVESVKNYKTVKITDSSAGLISNFAVTKIVNGSETRKVSGSVTLVRAEADTIENYSKVTMTDSNIGNALNVQRVTASKGFNTLEKFVGTVGNDTLTIGKNAVLVLNGADFGEGKDKFVNSGTLIFGSDFEINAETLSGKGNFAATSEVYEKLSGKVSGLLNLGQTYEGFRNTQYELADNTEKKAVKWDMKSDYNGWLNSDIGFEDTVDFIKFKAKENSVIKISGEFSGGTDKITLNGSVLTADADGNYIAMVSAKTDYILKLERNEMNSVNYEISLIA